MEFVAADPSCTIDTDCTADPTLKHCNVEAGVCTIIDDPPNVACTTVAAGMSVTLGGECVADCKNVDTTKPAVNVGGFHDVAGVCTEDTPASTTDNNACMPVIAGFSVNALKQTCAMNCTAVIMASHVLNGKCIADADSTSTNTMCTPNALANFSINSVTTECQRDCLDVTNPTRTFNTIGFHAGADGTECQRDVGSHPTNDPCSPLKPGFSMNLVEGSCEEECYHGSVITPVRGNHTVNAVCVMDTTPDNKECKTPVSGKSVTLGGQCVKDCKDVGK